MNFMELAKKRCSVRAYEDKPVAPEHLQAVLEAGRLAPTGKNHQPQRLLVVQSPEGLEKMAKAMHNTNAYTAKAVIMVCSDTSDCWVRSFDGHCIHEIDASIVTTYMMLAATEQGLGSLWVERFDPAILREEFQLPGKLRAGRSALSGLPQAGGSQGAVPLRHRTQAAERNRVV